MTSRVSRAVAITGIVGFVIAGGGLALASSAGPAAGAARATFECVGIGHPATHYIERGGVVPRACRAGYVLVGIGARGPAGPRVSLLTTSLGATAVPTQLQYIGGTIRQTVAGHGATNVIHLRLWAGTYLVNADVTFDRSVSAADGAPDTYGYAALWTGATVSTPFTDFSQGAGTFTTGPLSRLVGGTFPNLDVIDAVASGSHILVVPRGGEVLNLSAFAYNADESGGPFTGCAGSACTASDLSEAGSVIVTGADLSVIRVG